MTTLQLSAEAVEDLDHLVDFLEEANPASASALIGDIIEALTILTRHPLVGCLASHELRELVISRGKTGYVALYEYDEVADTVLVLGLRHQRESGFH